MIKKKILLIEDDDWMAQLQGEILAEAGFSVRVARHAHEAIALIDAKMPDIIIADVLLAGATIFTLLNELQSHHDTGEVPVILCTSIAEQFTPEQLKTYGVRRVIDKATMESDALTVAVKAVLGG
ncbi:response regulator [Candidatus Saccharibacteria bacterium TM7i]|nr:response regulator [Candidatus Saccharibacteria bacterium TM7i]